MPSEPSLLDAGNSGAGGAHAADGLVLLLGAGSGEALQRVGG